MSRRFRLIAPVASLVLLSALGDAHAITAARSFVQNASGACQPALPVYDGLIRKRPLAIQNEGTASAFVTCSFTSTDRGVGGVRSIDALLVYAVNSTGSAVNMTCTFVDGFAQAVAPNAIPKTRTLPANSTSTSFTWSATTDNGGMRFLYTVNVSCNLPVGTGLSMTIVDYSEDIGA